MYDSGSIDCEDEFSYEVEKEDEINELIYCKENLEAKLNELTASVRGLLTVIGVDSSIHPSSVLGQQAIHVESLLEKYKKDS